MSDQVLFTGARLFTGVNDEVIEAGAVWVDGPLIRYAGRAADVGPAADGARRIDLGGRFVMPGMTESHAHISYTNNGPGDLDKTPVEQAMVWSIDNARLMLGSGFTSAISFGSVHRIDVHLRDAIDKGFIVGPRLCASGRDIGATASNADLHRESTPTWSSSTAIRSPTSACCRTTAGSPR